MKNQQIKRPPVQLKGYSKITDLETGEKRSGIVFDSIEDVCEALKVYAGIENGMGERGYVRGMQESHGSTASALLLFGIAQSKREIDPEEFLEDLTRKVAQSVKSRGYYNNHYESQVFGSPLFNCVFEVTRYTRGRLFWGEEKYILSVRGAEQGLAKRLGRNMALDESRINGRVSMVDSQWFHLDMAELFSELKLKPDDFRQLAHYLSRQGSANFSFMYGKSRIDVKIELPTYYFPQVSEIIRQRLGKKGNLQTAIAGPALTYDQERIEIGNPGIRFRLGTGYKYVFDHEIATLNAARDYLIGVLQKS